MMVFLLITTQNYRDDYLNMEYQLIKAKFILWREAGKGLNVKKAFFLLFMFAGAPGGSKFIQTGYPPLNFWWREGKIFRHNSTGRVKKRFYFDNVLCDPSG
jgi:hypothetical protein